MVIAALLTMLVVVYAKDLNLYEEEDDGDEPHVELEVVDHQRPEGDSAQNVDRVLQSEL